MPHIAGTSVDHESFGQWFVSERQAQRPEGAEPIHSGHLQAGEPDSRAFDGPGTHRHFFIPDEAQGRTGTAIVE